MSKTTKTILIIFFALLFILLCCGAYFLIKYFGNNSKEENIAKSDDITIQTDSKYYTPTEEELKKAKELEEILKSDLPVMDGSTSTIPLEGGIKSALFGISQEKAEAGIAHSTTYGSFDNLIDGKCDIIFSTPISQEQRKAAEDANVELVETPVVYEGFVFVVNAKNPVDTLTQKQLKDIYSGKITNWKELGGNDAEIVAYQRNETSGSQNYMKEFMKDSTLMDPVTSFTPASMSGLMDAIASYDNAENAIGYSVYAYAANMYGNGNEVKFIKVDGVDPTKETMASKEYPLLNYNYAIYNKKSEETTTVDELTEWLLTYNGQVAMINAGYVPIKNIKPKELKVEAYNKKGTSTETKNDNLDDFYYYVEPYELTSMTNIEWWNKKDEQVLLENLKNKDLQNEINNFIKDSREKLSKKETECKKYVELLNPGNFDMYRYSGIETNLSCINGYLSIQVSLGYYYEVQEGKYYIYDSYSKVYDLYSGKELEISDLFYKNENFVDLINKKIKERIPFSVSDSTTQPIDLKHDFPALPKDGFNFKISEDGLLDICFNKDNPYFMQGETFVVNTYLYNISCINKGRNMSDLFDNNVKIEKRIYRNNFDTKLDKKETTDYEYSIHYFDSNNKDLDTFVNDYIKKELINNENTTKLVNNLLEEHPEYDNNSWTTDGGKKEIEIYTELYGNKYVMISISWGMEVMDIKYFDVENKNEVSEETVKSWEQSYTGEID